MDLSNKASLEHYQRKSTGSENELLEIEQEYGKSQKDLESITEKALAMSQNRLKPRDSTSWLEKEIGQTLKRITENEKVLGRIEDVGLQLIEAKEEYHRTESFVEQAETHVDVRMHNLLYL